jgi:hypothetical protein
LTKKGWLAIVDPNGSKSYFKRREVFKWVKAIDAPSGEKSGAEPRVSAGPKRKKIRKRKNNLLFFSDNLSGIRYQLVHHQVRFSRIVGNGVECRQGAGLPTGILNRMGNARGKHKSKNLLRGDGHVPDQAIFTDTHQGGPDDDQRLDPLPVIVVPSDGSRLIDDDVGIFLKRKIGRVKRLKNRAPVIGVDDKSLEFHGPQSSYIILFISDSSLLPVAQDGQGPLDKQRIRFILDQSNR